MTPTEYDAFAIRMATKNKLLMPLDVAVQGLCSEAGEVAGLVKKVWERDMPISMAQMLSELGDVALYLSVLAQRFGFSMEEVWAANVDKLERRFPER